MKKFNEIGMEDRCIVNGDTAIKPYYYMRNGLLHVRFTVDRCVELSKTEENQIKTELDGKPEQKQNILGKHWNLLTVMVQKPIITDGIKAGEEKMMELSRKYENYGYKNKSRSV